MQSNLIGPLKIKRNLLRIWGGLITAVRVAYKVPEFTGAGEILSATTIISSYRYHKHFEQLPRVF